MRNICIENDIYAILTIHFTFEPMLLPVYHYIKPHIQDKNLGKENLSLSVVHNYLVIRQDISHLIYVISLLFYSYLKVLFHNQF